VHTQAGYALTDERRKRTDDVTSGDDKRGWIEEEVPEVSTTTSNQEKWRIRKAVAFGKQPAKTDPIANMTPKTPKAVKVLRKKALALDTGHYEVLESCQLNSTILAHQERETGRFTFRLLPKAKTVSVPKEKPVTTRTLGRTEENQNRSRFCLLWLERSPRIHRKPVCQGLSICFRNDTEA